MMADSLKDKAEVFSVLGKFLGIVGIFGGTVGVMILSLADPPHTPLSIFSGLILLIFGWLSFSLANKANKERASDLKYLLSQETVDGKLALLAKYFMDKSREASEAQTLLARDPEDPDLQRQLSYTQDTFKVAQRHYREVWQFVESEGWKVRPKAKDYLDERWVYPKS